MKRFLMDGWTTIRNAPNATISMTIASMITNPAIFYIHRTIPGMIIIPLPGGFIPMIPMIPMILAAEWITVHPQGNGDGLEDEPK
jgi:CRISPR/Cas system-associated protein Csm6